MSLNGAAAHAFTHVLYKSLLFMSMGAVLYRAGTVKARITSYNVCYTKLLRPRLEQSIGLLSVADQGDCFGRLGCVKTDPESAAADFANAGGIPSFAEDRRRFGDPREFDHFDAGYDQCRSGAGAIPGACVDGRRGVVARRQRNESSLRRIGGRLAVLVAVTLILLVTVALALVLV